MAITSDAYKLPILGMYYMATLPGRRRAATKRAANGGAPVTALFYHRVTDNDPNDWTISTERFQAQVNWLRERMDVISLVEAQRRIGAGVNRTPAATITFDDGYADNCRTAVPWLIEQQIPFTYFVASNHILDGRPFEHDVRRGRPLTPNTPDEVRAMAEAGVEIGAHTRRHVNLGPIDDPDALYDEIVGSKRDLEAITGRSVRYFAFPFGLHDNLSQAAFATAFRAGYWGVCSAYGGYNMPGDDPFHIQRVHGDPSWTRFCNWLTFDPRKQRRVERFRSGDYRLSF